MLLRFLEEQALMPSTYSTYRNPTSCVVFRSLRGGSIYNFFGSWSRVFGPAWSSSFRPRFGQVFGPAFSSSSLLLPFHFVVVLCYWSWLPLVWAGVRRFPGCARLCCFAVLIYMIVFAGPRYVFYIIIALP